MVWPLLTEILNQLAPSTTPGGSTHSGMVYSAALILRKSSWGMLS